MELASMFSSHMVLQWGCPIRIFGTGTGEITVTFRGKTTSYQALENSWCFFLEPEPAGGPDTMTITLNGEIRELEDVLVGDVWIAAGQSNMEMPLEQVRYTSQDIPGTGAVRLYQANVPAPERGPWMPGTAENCLAFSAIGVFFAGMMHREYQIPVGIISCNRGASCVETWTERALLEGTDLDLPAGRRHGDALEYPWNVQYGTLYEELLRPLFPFSVCGVLWYQGESNRGVGDGALYSRLLEVMVKNWRERFQLPQLPFLIVQLTKFGEGTDESDNWAVVRNQQRIAARLLEHTAMVTTLDLGDSKLIHPLRKREIAQRLFWAAQNLVFGEPVEYSGPVIQSAKEEQNGAVRLRFSHSEGLLVRGDLDLWVCGEDKAYQKAQARLEGESLLVWAPEVSNIRGIKFCHRNCPEVGLWNRFGLPASPFSIMVPEGD